MYFVGIAEGFARIFALKSFKGGSRVLFTTIILLVWVIYSFAMKKRLHEDFRVSGTLLPLMIFSVIASVSLGTNYLAAAIPSLNDGISMHNFLASLIIGEDNWSYHLFKTYFEYSLALSISLLIVYSGLKLVKN